MKKNTLILIGFILLKFILQYFILNSDYDLQRDEYLHLDQANHLAWGFQSVPPFTSWVAYIIKALGNGEFWVKFFPALYGVLTIVVVWKTIEELNGKLYALILGASCVLFSALLRLNSLFQPNSFDVLCWTTIYFILIKYINSKNKKWLYTGSLVFAFAFLNKYNIVFLLIGLLPAILLSEHRKIFTKKDFYIACILGLLLIAPNLLWQYKNDFPVIHHMKELAATQLVNVNRGDFLMDQLLFFFAALPVIFAALFALLFYPPFKKFKLFFGTMIFTLIIFMYFRAKSYYAVGLYPIYIAFGSVFLEHKLSLGWKKYLRPILVAIPILFCLLIWDIISVQKPEYYLTHQDKFKELGMLRWEDGKDHKLPQDFADMLGWKELAEKTDLILSQIPNREETLILCDNYGQAGAINYYGKFKNLKAVSFNADYINWFPLDKKIKNVIRIKEFDPNSKELATTGGYFETAYKADAIASPFAREYQTTIFVFENAKLDVNPFLKNEINAIKNNWK